MVRNQNISRVLMERAGKIRLVLTDNDGCLTDTGVYYSANGEELKRFSIRDGMGFERLRKLVGAQVGIITGENSMPLKRRAEKLRIEELHLGIKDKEAILEDLLTRYDLEEYQVAYLGDDTNDLGIMRRVGLAGCPADAMSYAKEVAHFICPNEGGHGAFRDFAELIIAGRLQYNNDN